MSKQEILLKIGVVAKRLGLSVHTIRAWEKRYQAIEPLRTPGGGRLYAAHDVEKLAVMRDLARLGHSVGTLAGLPLKTLRAQLAAALERTPGAPPQSPGDMRAQFLDALANDDWRQLEQILSRWTTALPPRDLVLHVLAPVTQEVGERWFRKQITIGQEHLASGLIRTALGNLLRLSAPPANAPAAVAATPSGERHELGLLMASILAALQGWHVHYLGPDVPMAEVVRTVAITGATTVLLSLVNDAADQAPQVAALRANLPERVRVIAGGRAASETVSKVPGVQALTLEEVGARFGVR